MVDPANRRLSYRKVRDRSLVLLLVGLILLMPPVVGVSLIENELSIFPFPLIYVFVVWILLIIGAALLSRLLLASDESFSATGSSETETG